MPRYFFHVYHDRPELDEEGEELPDAQAAWREATVTVGQIIQDLNGRLRPGRGWRMEVTTNSRTGCTSSTFTSKNPSDGMRRPRDGYFGLRNSADASHRSIAAAASLEIRRSRSWPGGKPSAFARARDATCFKRS
jgi:hypothetical protein